MERVCICGGGSLGHVVAGYVAAHGGVEVNVLTRHPRLWSEALSVTTPGGATLTGKLHLVTDDASQALRDARVVLLCLPGYAIRPQLGVLAPLLRPGQLVGTVFSSTGFFFEAQEILPPHVGLWGFQRVPFIARTLHYGHKAALLGYKSAHKIAVERAGEADKARLCLRLEQILGQPVELLANHYEASFTNSNPILHPSRLHTLFSQWTPQVYYPMRPLFYEDWTDEASRLLIALDEELFALLGQLPVTPGFLTPILPYYESDSPQALTRKLRSIAGFRGILTPMVERPQGWQPQLSSRYFQEDFHHGLRYICQEARRRGVATPISDRVLSWGENMCALASAQSGEERRM